MRVPFLSIALLSAYFRGGRPPDGAAMKTRATHQTYLT